MTEGTATAPATGNDAIYAVGSPTHRLEVSNNGGSLQLLAVWPCTFTGCMVYASSATGNPETTISAGTLGLPLLWGGGGTSVPGWGGTSIDIQTNSIVTEIGNTTPGTSTNKLVILSAPVTTALVTAALTGSTTGVVGICVSGCGSSGTAQIAIQGIASCVFSNSTTAGDYVQSSSGTAADCFDAGSTYPTNGQQVLGRVLGGGSAGTWPVNLYGDEVVPPNQGTACSNKVITALNNASGPTCSTVTTAMIGTLAAGSNGLAASATTDTTNASNISSGTLPHARLPTLLSGDIPNNAANTTGTAGGLSGTPAITVGNITSSGTMNFTGGTLEIPQASGAAANTTAGTVQVSESGASTIGVGDGTNTRIIEEKLFKGLSFSGTGNATSLTTVFTSPSFSSGSLTLVANQQIVGSTIHVHVIGPIVVGVAGSVSFQVFLNGKGLVSIASQTTNPQTSSSQWEVDFWIYCSATGGAGTATMKSYGVGKIYNNTSSVFSLIASAVNSTNTTVNTSTTQLVDVQAQFGTSNASNNVTASYAEVDIY